MKVTRKGENGTAMGGNISQGKGFLRENKEKDGVVRT
jgi:hypothetical protein